ncbi:MAG: single-stranded DNA-binding protein [Bacteroidales bacterium]|nr:single-stranded DNA-binding protein [Bacteroidales bacterium]
MSVNKVILLGNVGRDPIIRYTADNVPVASFSLATNEYYKDNSGNLQRITEWHTIVAWRNLAELAEKHIRKGSQIYVEGRLRTRTYTDVNQVQKVVVEVIADNIQLLGKKEDVGETNNNNINSQSTNVETINASETKNSTMENTENVTELKNINSVINSGIESDDLPF